MRRECSNGGGHSTGHSMVNGVGELNRSNVGPLGRQEHGPEQEKKLHKQLQMQENNISHQSNSVEVQSGKKLIGPE